MGLALVRTIFLAYKITAFSLCFLWQIERKREQQRGVAGRGFDVFLKNTDLWVQGPTPMTTFILNYLLIGTVSNIVTSGLELQSMNLYEGNTIQSITNSMVGF